MMKQKVLASLLFVCALMLTGMVAAASSSGEGRQASDAGQMVQPALLPAPWTTYHSYNKTNSLSQELFNLSAAHPDICKVFSIGKTWQGRDIWCMKISDNVNVEENEPGVYYDGSHHAREWMTTELCMYIIHKFVDEYGTNATITNLVDNRQIFVVPLVNVDGRVYDGKDDGTNPADHNRAQGMGWRKNCRDNNGNGIFEPNIDGVDLNRNYAYQWCNGGSDTWYGSDGYMGPDPFSEPETCAIRDLISSHSISTYISYHSYSQVYLYPWAWTTKPCADNALFDKIGKDMLSLTTNKAGSHYAWTYGELGSVMYIASGASGDWAYGARNIIAMGAEIYPNWDDMQQQKDPAVSDPYDVFHPIASKILPACQDSLRPALYLAEIADNPYKLLGYHFKLSTTDTAVQALPSQQKTVKVTLLNNGQNDDTYTIQPSQISGWTVQAPATLSVNTNSSLEFDLDITPASGASGVYTIYINGTSENDTGTTASLMLTITVPYGADTGAMSIDNFTPGGTYPRGGYDIKATVKNLGTAPQASVNTKLEVRKLLTNTVDYTVFEDDFEGADKGWTTTFENVSDWEAGTPSGNPPGTHSGTNCWGTQLTGSYPNDANDWLISPPIKLPSNASTVSLSFWQWYKFHYSVWHHNANYDDWSYLRLYENGVWHRLGYYENSSNGWVNPSIDISAYKGKTVNIGFQFMSDSSGTSTGWFIDDVTVAAQVHPEVIVFSEVKPTSAPLNNGDTEQLTWSYTFTEEATYKLVAYTMLPGDLQEWNNATECIIIISGAVTPEFSMMPVLIVSVLLVVSGVTAARRRD